MVHYIRYLRIPQISSTAKKSLDVSAVAAVTSDLGDTYFAQDMTLHARVVDATKSGETLCEIEVYWKAHSRAVKLKLNVPVKHTNRLVAMHITTQETIGALARFKAPAVVDVWSSTFNMKPNSEVDTLVERRLPLKQASPARMWEETGDSIARHIWDASLGCVAHFNSCFDLSQTSVLPRLQELLTRDTTQSLKVLELGAGCGLVGISLAQMRKCKVLLTDLEDAQDILKTNLDCAKPASGSTLESAVLQWGEGINGFKDAKFDLVLVSDCIYNPDSSVLLAQTLKDVTNHNPNIVIFVAFKRRHNADEVFFEHVANTSLHISEHARVSLPHLMTEHDESEPCIEFYLYQQ